MIPLTHDDRTVLLEVLRGLGESIFKRLVAGFVVVELYVDIDDVPSLEGPFQGLHYLRRLPLVYRRQGDTHFGGRWNADRNAILEGERYGQR